MYICEHLLQGLPNLKKFRKFFAIFGNLFWIQTSPSFPKIFIECHEKLWNLLLETKKTSGLEPEGKNTLVRHMPHHLRHLIESYGVFNLCNNQLFENKLRFIRDFSKHCLNQIENMSHIFAERRFCFFIWCLNNGRGKAREEIHKRTSAKTIYNPLTQKIEFCGNIVLQLLNILIN